MGSNPARCWAFLLINLFLLSFRSVLNQVPQRGAFLTLRWESNNGCLAVLPRAETSSKSSDLGDRLFDLLDDGLESRLAHLGRGLSVLVPVAEALGGRKQEGRARDELTSSCLKTIKMCNESRSWTQSYKENFSVDLRYLAFKLFHRLIKVT